MKKKILYGILSFVMCLTFGLGCYFVSGGKISLPVSTSQSPEQTQTEISGSWSDYRNYSYSLTGQGSEVSPYNINTPQDLAYLSHFKQNFYNKHFQLNADLDMSAHYWENNGTSFMGVFDGNNHTITGLHTSVFNGALGLFHSITSTGEVKNISCLEIECNNCEGTSAQNIAGLAGQCLGKAKISNVNVKFTLVTGELFNNKKYIGGFAGSCASGVTFENCTAGVDISCGKESNSNDHSNTEVYIGGIVGYVSAGSLIANFRSCNAYGQIKYTNPSSGSQTNIYMECMSIGGIVGQSAGRISLRSCKNSASIYIYGYYLIPSQGQAVGIGGILGRLSNPEGISTVSISGESESNYRESYYNRISEGQTFNSIESCINTGFINVYNNSSLSGNYFCIGGICGVSDDSILIRQCYNAGDIYPGIVQLLNVAYYDYEYWLQQGVGGIIGIINRKWGWDGNDEKLFSIVTDCLNDAQIGGDNLGNIIAFYGGVGGIAGDGSFFKINRCINRGYIIGDDRVGGILGRGDSIVIGNSINAGYIKSRGTTKGQIVSETVFRTYESWMYYCYGRNDGGPLCAYTDLGNSPLILFRDDCGTLPLQYFNSNEFYTNKKYSACMGKEPITINNKKIHSGLLGWYYGNTFSELWNLVDGNYNPINREMYINIGGIYLKDNSNQYRNILSDEFTYIQRADILSALLKSIKIGNKTIYSQGYDIIRIVGGIKSQRITIDCANGVSIVAVQSYGENDKENFKRDLNIKRDSNSFDFYPMFDKDEKLSCSLYIYLEGKAALTPQISYYVVDLEGGDITSENAGLYFELDKQKSYFKDANSTEQNLNSSVSMTLFNTISFQITPKFGYAFYGISSTGTTLNLDLADNTQTNRNCQSVGGNDVKGTISGNDFYLGVISGSFKFLAQKITIILKPVTYGLICEYDNKEGEKDPDSAQYASDVYVYKISMGKSAMSLRNKDLHDVLHEKFAAFSGNGYYFDAYYKISKKDDVQENDKLKTFVDTDGDIDRNGEKHGTYARYSELDNSYYTLEFEDVWEKAEQAQDIDTEFLHVVLERTEMKTTVTLNDYQNYFYDLDTYSKVEDGLTKFGDDDESQTQIKNDFTADKGSASFILNPVKGYKTDYISIANDRYYAKGNENRKSVELSAYGIQRTFDLKNIYVQYLASLSDATLRKHMSIEGISQDRTTTINFYIYYSLMTYKVSVTTELVNRDENPASSTSLSTNENSGYQDYTNESAYTAELPSDMHYYSGLKLDLKVVEGERLAGVYFGVNDSKYQLVDISAEKSLIFYYLNTNDGADTLKIMIRFVKYDVGEAPNLIRGVYYISEPKHLQWLSYQVAMGNDFRNYLFKQSQDIDMSGFELNPIGGVLDNGTVRAFKGTYDGNFYRIINLSFIGGEYQNNLSYMGLFGYVEDATIMHLMVEGANSLTGWANVGGVVGYAKNSTFTRVDNRSLSLSINSQSNVLNAYEKINENDNKEIKVIDILSGTGRDTNTVAVRENYGGLVGYAEGCSFLGCSNQANVAGAAGLIGTMNGGSLDQCFTTQNSLYTNSNADIKDCYYIKGNNVEKVNKKDDSVWTTVNGRDVLKIFYWNNQIPQN